VGGDHNKAPSKVLGRTNQYMLHVWHVYLLMDFYSFHVGKIYQSHGFYGIYRNVTTRFLWNTMRPFCQGKMALPLFLRLGIGSGVIYNLGHDLII